MSANQQSIQVKDGRAGGSPTSWKSAICLAVVIICIGRQQILTSQTQYVGLTQEISLVLGLFTLRDRCSSTSPGKVLLHFVPLFLEKLRPTTSISPFCGH